MNSTVRATARPDAPTASTVQQARRRQRSRNRAAPASSPNETIAPHPAAPPARTARNERNGRTLERRRVWGRAAKPDLPDRAIRPRKLSASTARRRAGASSRAADAYIGWREGCQSFDERGRLASSPRNRYWFGPTASPHEEWCRPATLANFPTRVSQPGGCRSLRDDGAQGIPYEASGDL